MESATAAAHVPPKAMPTPSAGMKWHYKEDCRLSLPRHGAALAANNGPIGFNCTPAAAGVWSEGPPTPPGTTDDWVAKRPREFLPPGNAGHNMTPPLPAVGFPPSVNPMAAAWLSRLPIPPLPMQQPPPALAHGGGHFHPHQNPWLRPDASEGSETRKSLL